MLHELPAGEVRFEHVVKIYRLGRPRAYLAAAWPAGNGIGKGTTIRALDDVSFAISAGESIALIGANGAGKSTALKCLAGITLPTEGRIRRGGRVVALIELGIGFHQDLTGLENARFAASIAGLRGRAAEQLVERAVEFSGLERFITTPVKRYSSGMYARLSFGIAANLPADILIVDEILAVGDLAFQRKCYAHLRDLRREAGTTLVFVSHNEWVLKETCQRGVLISHGQVQGIGPVDDLLNAYHAADDGTGGVPVTVSEGGHRIRFVSVDTEPAGTRTVALHAPLDLRIVVDVADGVESAVVSVLVYNSQGRHVVGIMSDEKSIGLGPGRQDLRVRFEDVSWLPGPFRLEVTALERGEPQGEDVRRLEFEVVGDVPNAYEHGIVHVPSTWTLV